MKKSMYSYVDRDLLSTPEKYQMTPFEGIGFLDAYKESRKKILDTSSDNNDFNLSDNILNLINTNENNEVLDQSIFLTKELLLFIYKKNRNTSDIIHKTYLDRIIKKFEIKKKIYEQYDNQIKEVSSEHSDIVNYILLSINCSIAYKKSHNLRYLNTSLKLNDLLISQIKKLVDKNILTLCRFALRLELDAVIKICQEKGINWK